MGLLSFLAEGMRMYRRHRRVKRKGFWQFKGDALTIAHAIIAKLWNGKYLQTDLGNYPQFYSRDFGMCLPALLKLGMRQEAKKTLSYALRHYQRAGKVTTHLSPNGKAINFPSAYSPDSTAYLLRSVRLLGDKEMTRKYKPFLRQAAKDFANKALGREGKVRRKKHLGGMRDHAIRDASCYDTVMAAVVQQECSLLGIKYKHHKADYKKILLDDYWTEDYFKDDMNGEKLTADANIYPFWLGIINDDDKLRKAITSMQAAKLDKPFPIKYVANAKEQGRNVWQNLFVPDWEEDSIWPMSGLPYIDLMTRIDKEQAKKHHEQYEKQIKKYCTFIEVYDREGKPYKSKWFTAGEGMIWTSMWLAQRTPGK